MVWNRFRFRRFRPPPVVPTQMFRSASWKTNRVESAARPLEVSQRQNWPSQVKDQIGGPA